MKSDRIEKIHLYASMLTDETERDKPSLKSIVSLVSAMQLELDCYFSDKRIEETRKELIK